MKDKTLVATTILVALMMLSMVVAPSMAFVYPDGSQDNLFELDGPHIDQILIKKYAGTTPEFQALQAGEIDITDWALDATWMAIFNADPNVRVLGYGGEAGYYTFNFNHNNNTYLGNPQDPAYANPRYPNPTSVISLRQAFSYLIDRVALCAGPGEGLYDPIFTPIPAYMAYWIHPDITYPHGALAYPPMMAIPDPITVAANLLTADGFKMGGPGGKRYWDRNGNNIYDGASEDLNIIIYSRADKLRKGAADFLCAGLDNPAIQVAYTRYEVTGGEAWQKVMVEKDYNMYTAGWIFIGPDPDYLYDLYHYDNYYHPEDPPNFGAIGVDDPLLQSYSAGIKYASSVEEALTNALLFQEQFAATACEIPLGSTAGSKAYKKFYTGGTNGVPAGDAEDAYRGKMWTHFVNEKGQGENSWWTTLNAYPVGMDFGDGNMIARMGWKDNTMPQTLNPMYSSWYWESEIIGRVYDGLGARDPMTKGPMQVPCLADNWTVGTWIDPRDGLTKAAITVQIRPDVLWSDGQPLTIDDVIYTFIDLPKELKAKGCPDVVWQPTIDQIAGFYRLDKYTVQVLMKINAMWAMNWVVGNIVVPKHIWHPYIATHTVPEISRDFSGNPSMLVGTGPFLFVENTPNTVNMIKSPTSFWKGIGSGLLGGLGGTVIDIAWDWLKGILSTDGIKVEALPDSIQKTPFKTDMSRSINSKGKVKITIPYTNVQVSGTIEIKKTIKILNPDGTLYKTLVQDVITAVGPYEKDKETFTEELPKGKYTIKITIEITSRHHQEYALAGSTNLAMVTDYTESNVYQDFWITVPSDMNEDGSVDIFDIVPIAMAFGSMIGDPTYNPQADLNYDAKIDIFDIVIVAFNFGWSY